MAKEKRSTADLDAELAALEAEIAALEGKKKKGKEKPAPAPKPTPPAAPERAPADAPARAEPEPPAPLEKKSKFSMPKFGKKRSEPAPAPEPAPEPAPGPASEPEVVLAPVAPSPSIAPPPARVAERYDASVWRQDGDAWVRTIPETPVPVLRRVMDENGNVVREEPARSTDVEEVSGVKAERGVGKLFRRK